MDSASDCIICRGPAGDAEFDRVQVWEDPLWRLTVSLAAEVPGFAYLEPKRHIPPLADLDGAEAASFGPVIAKVTAALKTANGRTEERRVGKDGSVLGDRGVGRTIKTQIHITIKTD